MATTSIDSPSTKQEEQSNVSDKIYILEYIWIDGKGHLRSKYRTVQTKNGQLQLDKWNYDGSSTFQKPPKIVNEDATTRQITVERSEDSENPEADDTEVTLNPVAFYANPFFPMVQTGEPTSYIVLCDTFYSLKRNGASEEEFYPTETNNRILAYNVFQKKKEAVPWYGLEQEYFIIDKNEEDGDIYESFGRRISSEVSNQKGFYYCGVGGRHVSHQERALAEKHYLYCIRAGLNISGMNAEVSPHQWEFQIGPCEGVQAGDQLWVARYILHKLSEEFGVHVSFAPKPLDDPWNGSGLHTNFSTAETRDKNGLKVIHAYTDKLSKSHKVHMDMYGDNSRRLTGKCETSRPDSFTVGLGARGCSVRIPKDVLRKDAGYLEDRRPASDADPYLVTAVLFETCVGRDGLVNDVSSETQI